MAHLLTATILLVAIQLLLLQPPTALGSRRNRHRSVVHIDHQFLHTHPIDTNSNNHATHHQNGNSMSPSELLYAVSDKIVLLGDIDDDLSVDVGTKTAHLPLRRVSRRNDPMVEKFVHGQWQGMTEVSNVVELRQFTEEAISSTFHLYDERHQLTGESERMAKNLLQEFKALGKIRMGLQDKIKKMDQIIGMSNPSTHTPVPDSTSVPLPPVQAPSLLPPTEPTPTTSTPQAVDLRRFDAFPDDVQQPSVEEITYVMRMLAVYTNSVGIARRVGVEIRVDDNGSQYEHAPQLRAALNSTKNMLQSLEGAGLPLYDQAKLLGRYLDTRVKKIEGACAGDMPGETEQKKQMCAQLKEQHAMLAWKLTSL